MGINNSTSEHSEPQFSSSLDPGRLKFLESLFNKISDNNTEINEQKLLNYLNLPEYLLDFGHHFFVAISKQVVVLPQTHRHDRHHDKKHTHHSHDHTNLPASTTSQNDGTVNVSKSVTLPQLVRAVEVCWKGSTSEQMEFLISGYSHQSSPLIRDTESHPTDSSHHQHQHQHQHHHSHSSRSQTEELSTQRKQPQKIKLSELFHLFRDCGLLSVHNHIFEKQSIQRALEERRERESIDKLDAFPNERDPQQTIHSESDSGNESTESGSESESNESDSETNSKDKFQKKQSEQHPKEVETNQNKTNEIGTNTSTHTNTNNKHELETQSETTDKNISTHPEIKKEDFEKFVKPIIESIRRRFLRNGEENSDSHEKDQKNSERHTKTENNDLEIESSRISEWVIEYTPSLLKCLENFIQLHFLQDRSVLTQSISWLPEAFNTAKSTLFSYGFLWLITSLLDNKVKSYKLLYSSIHYGCSLNRFCHHVLNYNGPTVLIVQTRKGELFGAYVSQPWRVASSYQGDSDCFLFSLFPIFNIIKPGGIEKNYVYLFTNKHNFSGFPVGLGFGGTLKAFRLFLHEDLMKGEAKSSCNSFSPGKLVSEPIFDIKTIEVWGCGGETADRDQATALAREQKLVERARKVNRKLIGEGGWANNPDKFILDLVGKTGVSNGFREEVQRARKQMKANERAAHNSDKEPETKK